MRGSGAREEYDHEQLSDTSQLLCCFFLSIKQNKHIHQSPPKSSADSLRRSQVHACQSQYIQHFAPPSTAIMAATDSIPTLKVLITMHPGMDTLDFAGPLEALSQARHDKNDKGQ
jgi:hypothetical protein